MLGDETLQGSETHAGGSERRRPGLVLISTKQGPRCEAIVLGRGLVLGREGTGVFGVDDGRVSRTHCRVTRARAGWRIEDLDSRNGTVVDGARIRGAVIKTSCRVIRIGRCLFAPVDDIDLYRGGVTVEDGVIVGPVQSASRRVLRGLAPRFDTLLITGESGSGKELAAREFHRASGARGRFVAVNCAAIPVSVAERLLFGARRGAFSGARDADGYIQDADGGTLFLDEIGELDLEVQGKLLRVLETREVMALGSSRARAVDLRVCLATHKDLRTAVADRSFRKDLYFRVGRPEFRLPPLRERREEIPWLIEHVLQGVDARLEAHVSLLEAAALRRWPGNVRELIADVRTAGVRALEDGRERVRVTDLDENAGRAITTDPPTSAPASPRAAGDQTVKQTAKQGLRDRAVVEAAIAEAGGNLSAAARTLGVHRTQLYRWLDRHGIERKTLKGR